jgi:hypothetical protein
MAVSVPSVCPGSAGFAVRETPIPAGRSGFTGQLNVLATRPPSSVVIIRILVGAVFLSEGIQ